MDKVRCEVQSCNNLAEFRCQCSTGPLYMCEEHRKVHCNVVPCKPQPILRKLSNAELELRYTAHTVLSAAMLEALQSKMRRSGRELDRVRQEFSQIHKALAESSRSISREVATTLNEIKRVCDAGVNILLNGSSRWFNLVDYASYLLKDKTLKKCFDKQRTQKRTTESLARATKLLKAGKLLKVIPLFQDTCPAALHSNSAQVLTLLGRAYVANGQYEKAQEAFVSSLSIQECSLEQAELYIHLARIGRHCQEYTMVCSMAHTSFELSAQCRLNVEQVQALEHQAEAFWDLEDANSALAALETAASLAREFKLEELLARVLRKYGIAHLKSGSLTQAHIVLCECIDVCGRLGRQEWIPQMHGWVGKALNDLGDQDQAAQQYLNSISKGIDTGDCRIAERINRKLLRLEQRNRRG